MVLKALSIGTLAVLFSLIFIGGYVSASGVGLTCPEWPLCPKGLVPAPSFVIEYTHRTFAASTGAMVLITAGFVLRSKISPKGMKFASIIAAGAVIGQISLGAVVIVERLHSVLVTAHLGLGLILFSMVLMMVAYSWNLKPRNKTLEAKTQRSHLQ